MLIAMDTRHSKISPVIFTKLSCCKVAEMQNWSAFFFLFIYIWFDRAWRADHEYILFISIRPFFRWKNRKKLEWLIKCNFYLEFVFSSEIVEFQFQLFSELFENPIFRISMKNWIEKCYSIRYRVKKAKKIYRI